MAEEEGKEQEAEATDATAKAKKKKLIVFAAIGVVFLVLAIGAPVLYLTLGKEDKKGDELSSDAAHGIDIGVVPEGADDEDQLEENEEVIGAILPLEAFIVNLSGGGYLKLQIFLRFDSREVPSKFYTRIVFIRDGLITLLTNRTIKDLSSEKGKDALRADIKEVVNRVLKREDVRQVYFSQFLIKK